MYEYIFLTCFLLPTSYCPHLHCLLPAVYCLLSSTVLATAYFFFLCTTAYLVAWCLVPRAAYTCRILLTACLPSAECPELTSECLLLLLTAYQLPAAKWAELTAYRLLLIAYTYRLLPTVTSSCLVPITNCQPKDNSYFSFLYTVLYNGWHSAFFSLTDIWCYTDKSRTFCNLKFDRCL